MSVDLKIFVTLFLSVFVTTMGAGLVVPLLPVYAHRLGASAFQVGVIFGAFSLTRTLFVPYFGRLSDERGRKPFLVAGLFIYFVLSLVYVASENVQALILLRLAQGFASAMILPVAQAYVGSITPALKEGRIMGLFNVSLYGGLSIGPVVGGVVKDLFNIRFSFLAMGALAFVGFALCLLLLPKESTSARKKNDTRHRSVPYLKLMKTPSILSLFGFRSCFTTCVGVTWAFLPILASTKLLLSSSAIGIIVTVNVLVAGLLQTPMGFLADRVSKKLLVTVGGILAILAVLYLNKASSFHELLLANGLFGVAGGISLPAIMALGVIEGRKANAMGSLMGLLAQAHSLGMLTGPMLGGLLLSFYPFTTLLVLSALILGVGTIVFLGSY